MSTNIESHLIENRLFKPPKTFSKRAYVKNLAEYEELYRKSIKNPEKFWAQQASELLVWQKKMDDGSSMEGTVRQMVRRRQTECF
jgi:acetyl-CoA synthetase